MRQSCVTHALCVVDRATQCTVGVLAGTHWGDDSSRVMSHQSANPLWLRGVSGHGRDRGVMWTCHVDVVHTRILKARCDSAHWFSGTLSLCYKFEDRSQEETLKQERCARRDTWEMAKGILKLKEKEKTKFFSLSDVWCLPAPSASSSPRNCSTNCSACWCAFHTIFLQFLVRGMTHVLSEIFLRAN